MSRAFDTIRRDMLLTVLETFVNDSELRIMKMKMKMKLNNMNNNDNKKNGNY